MKTKVDSLRIVTGNHPQLLNDLFNKIDNYEIRTWVYDDDQLLSHTGDQYIDRFYFEYEIETQKGIIAFYLYADPAYAFARSKAKPLLERMLKEHFGDIIEIL